eukprot:gene1355-790_t
MTFDMYIYIYIKQREPAETGRGERGKRMFKSKHHTRHNLKMRIKATYRPRGGEKKRSPNLPLASPFSLSPFSFLNKYIHLSFPITKIVSRLEEASKNYFGSGEEGEKELSSSSKERIKGEEKYEPSVGCAEEEKRNRSRICRALKEKKINTATVERAKKNANPTALSNQTKNKTRTYNRDRLSGSALFFFARIFTFGRQGNDAPNEKVTTHNFDFPLLKPNRIYIYIYIPSFFLSLSLGAHDAFTPVVLCMAYTQTQKAEGQCGSSPPLFSPVSSAFSSLLCTKVRKCEATPPRLLPPPLLSFEYQ